MSHVKLFAIFSFRYDAQLIPDMIQNLWFVDGFVCHDDRINKSKWYHEGETRTALIEKARKAGADWVICVDPDERFENKAGKKIRQIIQTDNKVVFGFHFRELWTEDSYRIDGVWGKKSKFILFPLKASQTFEKLRVHSPWAPNNIEYERKLIKINLYHLKNIEHNNRIARSKLYNELDPNRKIQEIGYDYLSDEKGLKLKKIKLFERYSPKYDKSYNIVQVK